MRIIKHHKMLDIKGFASKIVTMSLCTKCLFVVPKISPRKVERLGKGVKFTHSFVYIINKFNF